MNQRPPASLDASYRKLTFTKGDLNAILIQAQSGHGTLILLRPEVGAARHALQAQGPSSALAPGVDVNPHPETPVSDNSPVQDMVLPVSPTGEEEFVAPQTVNPQIAEGPEDHIADSQITEPELDALADFAAHMIQPSAYAIPPQSNPVNSVTKEEAKSNGGRGFPASIPRAKTVEPEGPLEVPPEIENEASVEAGAIPPPPRAQRKRRLFKPNAHAVATRQMARAMVGGIRIGQRVNDRFRASLQRFVPRLLPSRETGKPLVLSTFVLVFIAVVIPVVVVTMASVVYFRLGQSIQYDELYGQALNARAQAVSETDPSRQRDAWQRVLNFLSKADEYRVTDQSNMVRTEAQAQLDSLMGVLRLEFSPAFPNGIGGSTPAQISHMAASESDLYMLDAVEGKILHAAFTGRGLELDAAFDCEPGSYSGYQVGTLIDLLALPKVNALSATVMGIDANGNLLYCAPDQVPQAIPLPSLPNTNWGRITSFALDNDSLYVLDAQSRAVWVFPGKDSTFIDDPYFYFGNEIPANIDSAIDMAVSNDDLYMLHADGHLSTCTFSRLSEVPTRCQDPAPRVDNLPAHRDVDIFTLTHFTQMSMTNPPNSVILLLDSENQSVFRFSPRSFELQNQVKGYAGKANPFQRGAVTAMAVSPNYVLYLAIGDQVYFATNMP